MENAELGIFSLNFIIVLVAYFLIYPKVAGSDINKISINDFFASVISLPDYLITYVSKLVIKPFSSP